MVFVPSLEKWFSVPKMFVLLLETKKICFFLSKLFSIVAVGPSHHSFVQNDLISIETSPTTTTTSPTTTMTSPTTTTMATMLSQIIISAVIMGSIKPR